MNSIYLKRKIQYYKTLQEPCGEVHIASAFVHDSRPFPGVH